VNNDNALEGANLVFGAPAQTIYRFDNADVILSLDADFIGHGPAHIRYARDFANRRRVQGEEADMNRLYVAESFPTVTGGMADHRLRVRASQIEPLARAVAAHLNVPGVTAPQMSEEEGRWISRAVADLRRHGGKSLVVSGAGQPAVVHALAHAINHALGNSPTTVAYTDPVEARPVNQAESLSALAADLDTGQIDLLVILGANPVYTAPPTLKFAEKLKKARLSVHLGLYEDETAAVCQWHIPEPHPLETWSDARAFEGTATIMQPLIAPLYNNGKSVHEFVDELLGKSGRKSHDIVREYWEAKVQNVDVHWKRWLNNGLVEGTANPVKTLTPAVPREGWKFSAGIMPGLELMFRPDPTVWDGRFANNGWLQECPKPLTKLTWDNALIVSPATAQHLGITTHDVVELSVDSRTATAPVWVQPGHPDDSATLHLGYGRVRAGRVGSRLGVNAYALHGAGAFLAGLELRKTGESYKLATTQDHHSMEGRPIVRAATLEEFRKEPAFARGMEEVPTQSFYPPKEYDGYAWGMTIDLNACTGCNACVIACQSENNIPIVGKDQVERGREMHWIRVDRYYKGDLDDPQIYHQPVTCMHCENAPCETVCPVAATSHDSEGLNVMTYNRCVGTRYCSNNCPYKVRRFNFLQYSDVETESMKMLYNPDVTVRNRGVMEKCTYCVQRISGARIEAKKEDRQIRDGELVTACQQACPASAIVFGDINDHESAVAKRKADPRHYALLASINTKPRTSYLAKLTNPHTEPPPTAG
jgi:molybdopterin-containing oxidoreductase family iron-sulfur binding subunit